MHLNAALSTAVASFHVRSVFALNVLVWRTAADLCSIYYPIAVNERHISIYTVVAMFRSQLDLFHQILATEKCESLQGTAGADDRPRGRRDSRGRVCACIFFPKSLLGKTRSKRSLHGTSRQIFLARLAKCTLKRPQCLATTGLLSYTCHPSIDSIAP